MILNVLKLIFST